MRTIKLWLATIAALLCSITASAHDFEMNGIYYNITSSTNLTVAVTYRGGNYNSYSDEYSGAVTIPPTVTYNNNTYSVTSIGNSAFYNCSSLTSITIPESVTSIGYETFYYCSGLTSIVIPNGVTSIGNYAFFHCDNLSSVIIGKNVTSIGECTFATSSGGYYFNLNLDRLINYSNVSLDEIYGYARLEVNVSQYTNIDDFLFDTTGEEISLVAYIGSNAELNLPSSFNGESYIIGSYAFSKTNITNVVISNNVTTIRNNAFESCANLASLTIGCNVSTIEKQSFADCNELETIYVLNAKAITCGESIFATDAYNNAILYVPSDRVFAYEKVTPWNKFQIEPMKKFTVTHIVDGEVYETIEMEYAAEITLPENPTKDGYTFMGWSEVPETMPANDITIYGTFAVNKYLVTFKIDDEVVASDSLEYGASIVAPEAPQKEGYTFNGWGEVAETVPASDVTYEGAYSVNSYKLTFIVDGEVVQESSVDYGATITLPEAPEKEGYSFDGWNEIPETMPASDVTVSGTFTINKYLVTFRINNEVIASDSLEYGASIVIPEAPEKEGYTFNGWGEVAKTVPAGDVTYEGNYSVNSYKLTFIVDGEVVQESSVDYGATITLPEKPTKEGYSFDGWNEIPETMPASDVTVSGTFTVNKYLVTFRINDEVIASDSLEYGASIVTPEAPEKEGYTFDGWANVPETVPACNLTFEGGYTANEYLLAFIVDGALYEMRKVRCDEKITALDMAEREGCTFVWENWIDKMPAKDYTVRGKYVPNKYAITYVADGEIVETDSIAYGTVIEALKEPVKEGYTFSGWSEVPETMPAEDVTISGTFIVNKYLVTFVIDDEVIASDLLEYGTAIVAPVVPEKEGHTFNGWGEVAETVPAEDVVISGSFTINTYKVYYYVGDVLVHTAEVAYGESIPEYVYEPTAEGDEFMGWVGETYETMPAHDVTYTANITNDISQCTISNSQLTIYNLNGRKIKADDLRELEKGIYIVNGKKVMIK